LCPTASFSPFERASATIRSASETAIATGFSTSTCRPAARQSSAIGACRKCGVATITASSGSFSSISR
jgi:hypothetical protein